MLTMNQINLDFNKAKSDAQALENLAASVDTLAKNQMDGVIDQLSKNWKGENATSFINCEENLKYRLQQYASDLRGIAADIRKTAQAIYETEKRNYEIAAKRAAEAAAKVTATVKGVLNNSSVSSVVKGVTSGVKTTIGNVAKVGASVSSPIGSSVASSVGSKISSSVAKVTESATTAWGQITTGVGIFFKGLFK